MKTKMFFGLLILCVLMSCQKKLDTVVDTRTYPVAFQPYLNGQIVPWIQNDKAPTTKGFAEFTHKYFLHVVRVYNSPSLTRVIDIPITTPSATGSYTYSLPNGNYVAEVLPITEQVASAPGTYTCFTNYEALSLNRAAIYTRTPVAFTVTGTASTVVVLNCVNDMSCLELDLGSDYTTAGVQQPHITGVYDNTFLGAHNGAGLEPATIVQLSGQEGAGNAWHILGTPAPALYLETNNLWYDNVAHIYYLYKIAGTPLTISVPNGLGTSRNYVGWFAEYLTFNLNATFPSIWLRDGYTTRTWIPNTTLRVSFFTSSFTVNQSDWFSTILTK